MPIPSVFNTRLSPYPSRAVEINEEPCFVADRLFNHEMSVKRHCLCSRQKRVLAVEMLPPRLHHPNFFVRIEIRQSLKKEFFARDKVCIEDRDKLARGRFKAVLQCAGFKPFA